MSLAAIVWLIFGQTLQHSFINFDDDQYVFRNPQVARGLTIEGIVWAFAHTHSSNWHPLTWISHMLDCQIYGLNPGGHHLTNVILHAATAIFLFLVLRRATGALWRSAFVAALFAVHPLRVESVAWVAERKDVLSGLFFVLTVAAYVRYARAPKSFSRYALVILLFAMGLLCKPMLITVPIILLLLDYWPLNRLAAVPSAGAKGPPQLRQLIFEKLPLLGLSLASGVITLIAQKNAIHPVTKISLPLRLSNAVITCTDYLRQMFWPADLALLYPWDSSRLDTLHTALSIFLVAGISVVVLFLRRKRYPVTGWFWYLAMLVPVIGILQVGNQARADRYTYLPEIGLSLALTWAAADLFARWRTRSLLPAVLAGIVLICLIFLAHSQAAYWQDSETIWSRTLACTGPNTVAEANLGAAYHADGRLDEAQAQFEKALRIQPNQAAVHSSLGVLSLEMGRVNDALVHLQKALEIEPDLADAHYNLGNTYLQLGQADKALSHYRKALELNPTDTEALNNMAWLLATWPEAVTRDGTKAVELAERANALTRNESPIACATLGAAYAEAGRFADALKVSQRALQLALRQGDAARADSIRAQIKLYESGAAYRDRRNETGLR